MLPEITGLIKGPSDLALPPQSRAQLCAQSLLCSFPSLALSPTALQNASASLQVFACS